MTASPAGRRRRSRSWAVRSLSLASLTALLLVAGCGGGDDEPTTPSKLPPEGELVVYARSGGLAFSSDQLAIDTEGHAVLTSEDGEGERRTEFDLTDAELTDLEATLAAATGLEVPGPTGACADCYSYSVEATGVSISLDDASFGLTSIPPEVTALIQKLGDLVSRNAGVGPSSELPEGELVVYSRTGGLAYLEDHLTIDTEGHAVLTSDGDEGHRRSEFDLTAKQLDELESALAAAAGVEVPPTATCGDCFSHAVEAEGVSFTLEDNGSPGGPAEATGLIQTIQPLLAKNYRAG